MKTNANIQSLRNTIKHHESYIHELETIHYRGAVTDDRIATMKNQIQECKDAILKLEEDERSLA